MKQRESYTYILTNKWNTVLYIGVTDNIIKRVYEHKNKLVDGFTKRYNITKLVWYEVYNDIMTAFAQEKQLKGGSREQKLLLIKNVNPQFRDLYDKLSR